VAVISWLLPTANATSGVSRWYFSNWNPSTSSASTCEGFALAGGRVANFTSGQGLILMKEVLYVIAGKRLPVVFHIGARALTSQGLNIRAGHDDVMGVADCGWGMLFVRNVQEAADYALIARRIGEESETPYFNIQDGFLTTHTIESLRLPETELMKQFVGSKNCLRVFCPLHSGTFLKWLMPRAGFLSGAKNPVRTFKNPSKNRPTSGTAVALWVFQNTGGGIYEQDNDDAAGTSRNCRSTTEGKGSTTA
jgi:hypothetical protein